ncbi:MAG: hypothetical protein ABFE02_14480 [Sulfuricella sp.]
MQLQRISLYRKNFFQNDGPFTGSIEVSNELGEIKLTLNDEEIRQVLDICCESLMRISHEAAERMREAIRASAQRPAA